jgi:putative ABC transport system substrate-binding protein
VRSSPLASDPFFNSRREQLVALASHHAVPAIWEWREFAEAGVEGQNVAIEYRSAEDRYDRLPALAADLVDSKVDVIATGGLPLALAAKSATSTIPIVFIIGTDPVELGLVASLARPGGNLTGIAIMATELMPKRFELLSELVPQASVIALLVNPNNASAEPQTRDVQQASRAKGVQLRLLKASTQSEIDTAFAILSSTIGASISWRWRHATPFRRSMSFVSSPQPAA